MTLNVPLAVRIKGLDVDRHITRRIRSLRFRSTVPGGFASASFAFDAPLSIRLPELEPYSRVYVYDRRTGRVVWEGRLEVPGKRATLEGQLYGITAVGPSAHARDSAQPLIYVDRDLYHWQPYGSPGGNGRISQGRQPGTDLPVILAQWSAGQPVAGGEAAMMAYLGLYLAGQDLAAVRVTVDAGINNASWSTRVFALTYDTSSDQAYTRTFSTTSDDTGLLVEGTDFTAGRDSAVLQAVWTGGVSATSGQATWAVFENPVVVATRFTKSGGAVSSYVADTVASSEVVADLLGRLLPEYDGANATITTVDDYAWEQLAYLDGTDPANVFSDLMLVQPNHYWAAWESNSSGLHRFEWSKWSASPRYEASIVGGFDDQGSAADLYNQVTVRYRDSDGIIKTAIRTSTVDALTNQGLTRTAYLDLGDEAGSTDAAETVGDAFLADHGVPRSAGRLTISRRVFDRDTGQWVMPWEILPGNMIRVRGLESASDRGQFFASARDGSTLYRIVGVDYDSEIASAVLELDSYAPSTSRMLADLAARGTYVRRR